MKGRPFIMYAPNGDQDPIPSYAFQISVMLKKCVQGEGGQIWPKKAYILNGRSLISDEVFLTSYDVFTFSACATIFF